MLDGRKTKAITYNLRDIGRKHTGQDRSDIDYRTIVKHINSPATQEMVDKGDLFGYLGHEVREQFGEFPPETWLNPVTGKMTPIPPALRTIELSADNEGNVTARHEFTTTETGEYAMNRYASNEGGFSTAIMRKKNANGTGYVATGFCGFDFVRTPNYDDNRGDGKLFDSLVIIDDGELMLDSAFSNKRKAMLDNAIALQLDNARTYLIANGMIDHYSQQAEYALKELEEQRKINQKMVARRKALIAKQQQVEDDLYDKDLCLTKPFNELLEEFAVFDSVNLQGQSNNIIAPSVNILKKGLF